MIPNNNFKKLVQDSAQLWAGQVLSVLIGFAVMVVITRMLSPEGRGIYAWMVTLSGLTAQMGMLGMDFVLRRLAGENPKLVPALISNSIAMSFLGGLGFSLLFGGFALFTPIGSQNAGLLLIALVATPFIVAASNFSSLLVALGRVRASAKIAVYSKAFSAILLGGLILFNAVNVPMVLAIFAVAWLMAALIGWKGLWDLSPTNLWSQPWGHLHNVWKYVLAAYVTSALFFIMQRVDVLIIGVMAGEEAAGYYGVSSAMAQVMFIAPSTLSFILLARLASFKTAVERRRLLWQSYAFMGGIMAAGGTVVAFLAPWIIEFLFGAAFLPAVPSLQILCAALVPLTFYILAQNALAATASARSLLMAPIAGVVANIGLNIVLIPTYGIEGSATAAFVSFSIAALVAGGVEFRHIERKEV